MNCSIFYGFRNWTTFEGTIPYCENAIQSMKGGLNLWIPMESSSSCDTVPMWTKESWLHSTPGNSSWRLELPWEPSQQVVLFTEITDWTIGWSQGDVIVNILNPNETYTLGANGVLSTLSLHGYQTKIFTLQSNVQVLDPVVEWVSPSHDSKINCSTWFITARFSQQMDASSVLEAVTIDGEPCSEVKYNETTQIVTCKADNLEDGIHKFVINETAMSTAG